MRLANVNSRASVGVEAPPVQVEVHIARGLPSLSIVGLPAAAVRESRDRVRAAINNAGFEFPRRRVIVNLAPADLPKVLKTSLFWNTQRSAGISQRYSGMEAD